MKLVFNKRLLLGVLYYGLRLVSPFVVNNSFDIDLHKKKLQEKLSYDADHNLEVP
jgi:hypothetical protein